MKKIFLIFLFVIFHSQGHSNEKTILLKYKINEDLITNYDIKKEAKYLAALNKDIQEIEQEKLLEFAEKSLIREKIKKYELEKYYMHLPEPILILRILWKNLILKMSLIFKFIS